MNRMSCLVIATIAAWSLTTASAQIIPEAGAPSDGPAQPAAVEPTPPAAPSPAAVPTLQTGFSNGDLEAAFKAVGLTVTQKTAPNGLQYLEGKNGRDVIFGAGLKCAGANVTDCRLLMLQSGTLSKSVPYADMMKFTTAGFSSRAVTFDPNKKYPALLQMTHIYGSFDQTLLTGSLKGLMGDMQAFLGMLQGQPVQAYASAVPEARLGGAFNGGIFDAAVSVQFPAKAN
ncbi:MAG: hypothetical protein QM698_00215 [Micropepsaceae bacterium]